MYAKVFAQIYDSSIVENAELRFTFMDMLVLSDCNGVVDMTHEAIARRTNRPVAIIRKTIAELEQPDHKSRTPTCNGARIKRLDEHREWGWLIINYDQFRKIASEEQRREKTLARVRKYREKADIEGEVKGEGKTLPVVSKRYKALPGQSKGRCTQAEAEFFCESIGLPKSDGTAMFLHWEEKGWAKVNDWQLTIRKWQSFGYLPSQKNSRWQTKAKNETKPKNYSFN